MPTDFRALCAELAKQLEGWQCYASPDGPNAEVLARARAALAQPEPQGPMPEVDDILRLAAIIREVDGNNDKGAAALAEAILSHPDSRWQHAQPEPQGPPKNCWLDDEPYLCPSPCVFDDPSEVIDNCVEARYLSEKGKPKEACKYYRTTSQPEPPTDKEVAELVDALKNDAKCAEAEHCDLLAQPEPQGPTMADLMQLWRACNSPSVFARAVLARWGRPAIEPVPVSERLPVPQQEADQ